MLDHLDAIGDARLAIAKRQLAQLPDPPVDPMVDAENAGDAPRRIEARRVHIHGDDPRRRVERKRDGEPAIAGADIRHHIIGAEAGEGTERLDIAAPVKVDGAVEIDIAIHAPGKMGDGADRLRLLGGEGTDQGQCSAFTLRAKGSAMSQSSLKKVGYVWG